MKEFRIDWKIIKDIYAVALPSIVMQSVASIVLIAYNWILSATPVAVAVLGVYGKIESFVFMPVFGLQQGALPLMAYNFGARNKKRMMETLKMSILISLVIISIGTAIFQLAPEIPLSLFHAEGEMMELGVAALREISLCFIPAAIGISLGTTFQATGHGVYMLIESLIRQVVGVLPLAYILYNFYGPEYTFYSYPLAEILGMIFGAVMFIVLYKKEIRDLDKVETCD
jgi:Na+-driven multidrug efflux pump